MNKYNDSYFLNNIVKKIKNNSNGNMQNVIKELDYFITINDNLYFKIEKFNSIKNIVKYTVNLNTLESINQNNLLNFEKLVIEINKLIKYIDYETYINFENNRYNINDYDYIVQKLEKVVYNTKI